MFPSRNYVMCGVNPGERVQTFLFPGPPSTLNPPQEDMEDAWNSTCAPGDGIYIAHKSVGQVNGQDIVYGTGGSSGFAMHNTITKVSRIFAYISESGNPGSCASCLAWADSFNKYGAPTDGTGPNGANAGVNASTSLIGPRYVVVSKSGHSLTASIARGRGGIWAFRTGPDDFDTSTSNRNARCRYLAHPMGDEGEIGNLVQ